MNVTDGRLSTSIDHALRLLLERDPPTASETCIAWIAMVEVLREIGIFARDVERTEAVHAGEPSRQQAERAAAALRLYGRLLEPPRAANVVPIGMQGLGRMLRLEGRRS